MVMMVEDVCICFVLVLGDIFTIPGLDCVSGDTFVSSAQMVDVSMENIFVPKPVVSMSITVKNQKQVDNFSKAINRSVITSRIELNTLKIKFSTRTGNQVGSTQAYERSFCSSHCSILLSKCFF